MKYQWKFVALITIAALTAGCGVTNPPADASSGIHSYCFPLSNGQQFRYAHFTSFQASPSYDTTTYQMEVGLSQYDTNRMVSTKGTAGSGAVLYNFVFETDDQGTPIVDFSNRSQHFVALSGSLADSSVWTADAVTITTAQVFAHYDQYFPDPSNPGISYQDVLVVKYHRYIDPPDNYTLRFYARGYGLILEKSVVGSATVIGTLELVAVGNPLP